MKQKLLTILLAVSCIANVTLCYLNISKNPTLITESVALEESYDQPSWGEIYKDPQTAVDEYQKQVQANIDLYNQQLSDYMNSPQFANANELLKAVEKAEKEKVVKGIKGDGKGNAIVTYANGTTETVNIYTPPTASTVGDVTVTVQI